MNHNVPAKDDRRQLPRRHHESMRSFLRPRYHSIW